MQIKRQVKTLTDVLADAGGRVRFDGRRQTLTCVQTSSADTNGQNNATGQTFTYPSPVDFGFEGI